MIPGVIFAGIVPDPCLSIHVGSLGVSGPVGIMSLWLSWSLRPLGATPLGRLALRGWLCRTCGSASRRRAAAGRFAGSEVPTAAFILLLLSFLGKGHGADCQNRYREQGSD